MEIPSPEFLVTANAKQLKNATELFCILRHGVVSFHYNWEERMQEAIEELASNCCKTSIEPDYLNGVFAAAVEKNKVPDYRREDVFEVFRCTPLGNFLSNMGAPLRGRQFIEDWRDSVSTGGTIEAAIHSRNPDFAREFRMLNTELRVFELGRQAILAAVSQGDNGLIKYFIDDTAPNSADEERRSLREDIFSYRQQRSSFAYPIDPRMLIDNVAAGMAAAGIS